jgi:hypothetical protein
LEKIIDSTCRSLPLAKIGSIVFIQKLKKITIGQTLKRRLQKPEIKGRKGKRAKAGWGIKNQITRKKGQIFEFDNLSICAWIR